MFLYRTDVEGCYYQPAQAEGEKGLFLRLSPPPTKKWYYLEIVPKQRGRQGAMGEGVGIGGWSVSPCS